MRAVLKSSQAGLAAQYGLGLVDLDGVVYRGADPVDHAAAALAQAEAAGMTVIYTTNNAARYQAVVAEQIRSFGIRVTPAHIITSAIVAARMVARQIPAGGSVFVVGAEHLRDEVTKAGLRVVESAEDNPDAVLQGWHPGLTWAQLAQAAYCVERGAQYFVTNRDSTIPRELGIAPGNGAMIEAVITATGVQPLASAGKPESAMYDEARFMNADTEGELFAKDKSLPVGDRLDTDIEAANRGGYDSLVVLTGVTDPYQLLTAMPEQRPTYISQDLCGLAEQHIAPQRAADGSYGLRGFSARLSPDGQRLLVSDQASAATASESAAADSPQALASLDGLRAACALAWELSDRGLDLTGLKLPDFQLESSR